jgi:hypothetical protein
MGTDGMPGIAVGIDGCADLDWTSCWSWKKGEYQARLPDATVGSLKEK